MNAQTPLSRRTLLQRGAALGATAAAVILLPSCSSPRTGPAISTPAPSQTTTTPAPGADTTTASTSPRTLLAYFSRPGENYYNGGRRNLDAGNTEVLAGA